jgi:signal transduction histidine kinase
MGRTALFPMPFALPSGAFSRAAARLAVWLAVLLATMTNASAAGEDWLNTWGETLAARFSPAWRANRDQHALLTKQLNDLPRISVTNFGGPSGYLSNRNSEPFDPSREPKWLEIRWAEPEPVDLVCLVPARVFDEYGLDRLYGLPEDFSVSLIDAAGRVIATVAKVLDSGSDPARFGEPFCYNLEEPVVCSGVRIVATRSHYNPKRPGNWQFMGWGEVMCFDGERNVALGAGVTASSEMRTTWPWKPEYVVDGITGIGLPEIPPRPEIEIGWLSESRASRDEPVWVEVDLGSVKPTTGARFFPPERPAGDLIPGFAFPERFLIEVSDTGGPDSYREVFDRKNVDFQNPGHHAVTLTWPRTKARFVRLRSLRMSKVAAAYPAFLGFSEFQVLDQDRNLALDCQVRVSEQSAPVTALGYLRWTPGSLTDGFTSKGKIISDREWMELLALRHRIQSQVHGLNVKAESITRRFRIGTITSGSLMVGAMLATLVILPVRYRRLEVSKLRALRAQIAADLHDEIGSSLGSIQLLTEAALRKPNTSAERLRLISLLSTGSVASLRDIVWLLRPGSAFQSPALSHFRETASILLDSIAWDFQSDAASRSCLLARETNRQLLLFFREALHNALRHSGCSRVDIRISIMDGYFELEITDDGCGIPEKRLVTASCLRALKERANRLDGSLGVRSSPGRGTALTLRFRLSKTNSERPK